MRSPDLRTAWECPSNRPWSQRWLRTRRRNPASLPLLQYTLTELYDRRDGTRLTLDAYRELGGLAGSVAGRADALCEEVGDVDAVRGLFERLVSPGAGTEDTRRRARMSELHGVPASVIEAFGDARLLAFDHDPVTREPTVEVAHEALIRNWPRLERLVGRRPRVAHGDATPDRRGRCMGGSRARARRPLPRSTPGCGGRPRGRQAVTAVGRARRSSSRRAMMPRRPMTVAADATLDGCARSRSASPSRSSARCIAGAIAVAQRNESTAQRNRAREQTALAEKNAALHGKPRKQIGEMAAQARALADVEQSAGAAARARGRSSATGRATPSGRSRLHCWRGRSCSARCTPVCRFCTSYRLSTGRRSRAARPTDASWRSTPRPETSSTSGRSRTTDSS